MKKITEKAMVEWAVQHKIGTKIDGVVISQYLQDKEGDIYIAFPLKDFMRKYMEE